MIHFTKQTSFIYLLTISNLLMTLKLNYCMEKITNRDIVFKQIRKKLQIMMQTTNSFFHLFDGFNQCFYRSRWISKNYFDGYNVRNKEVQDLKQVKHYLKRTKIIIFKQKNVIYSNHILWAGMSIQLTSHSAIVRWKEGWSEADEKR